MPFSRDSSNYLNHNKKLIASSLPSARFLQVQSPNKQTAFKVNRDSLQEWGNVNTQTGSNDPSASYSVQSLTPCDSKQMTNYPSFALNSCLLSPPQPHCPPLTFPNTVLLHWTSMNNTMINPTTVSLRGPYKDFYSTVVVLLLIPAQMPRNFVFFMLFFGIGNGKPLQYFCLENSMDGEAWQATGHEVPKSRTRLSMHISYFFYFPSRCCEFGLSLSWFVQSKNNNPNHCVMQTRGDLCLQTKREHITTGISY